VWTIGENASKIMRKQISVVNTSELKERQYRRQASCGCFSPSEEGYGVMSKTLFPNVRLMCRFRYQYKVNLAWHAVRRNDIYDN